jgi:hypothetical protein
MAVAAVYADWPWDDLATALDPNGQLLTNTDTPSADDISPAGVEKESWDTLLYSTSESSFLAPPGTDPTANVSAWFGAISAGEPYGSEVEAALSQLQQYHSAVGVPMPAGGPAPTALQNGWTDTLFPVSEGLHYAARLQAAGERTPLLMIFDDNGHGWAQDKPADSLVQTAKAIAFLNAIMLRHSTPPTGVVAIATTCPRTAPSEPRLSGPTFASLQAGSVSLGSAAPQIVTSSGGSASVARALDPADVSPLCQELPGKREPGTALYRLTMTRSATLLGGLVVHAELHVSGDFPELVGRLWDLDPRDGKRQLIEAGDLRPSFDEEAGATRRSSASGSVVFELPPNFYTVAAGHILELELVGSTAPWFRASNGRFRITVTGLTATIALARTSR